MAGTRRRHGVELAAVGDLALIGRIAGDMERHGPAYPFGDAVPLLREADVVFGNLEMPFSRRGAAALPRHQSGLFFHSPSAVGALSAAGFTVVSLANNHIMECGQEGLETTLELLREAGITAVGAGRNLEEAGRGAVISTPGGTVGFLAYAQPSRHSAAASRPGFAAALRPLMSRGIASLRAVCDHLVVSMHMGMMYADLPRPEDRDLCRWAIGEGADLVLGHHPHVLQGIERYRDGLILYSLGEFVFDAEAGVRQVSWASRKRRQSLILRANLGPGAVEHRLVPAFLDEERRVSIARGEEGEEILARVKRLSDRIAGGADFYREAGGRLVRYEIGGLLEHLRAGNLRHVWRKIVNLRGRHLRLFLGMLRRPSRETK